MCKAARLAYLCVRLGSAVPALNHSGQFSLLSCLPGAVPGSATTEWARLPAGTLCGLRPCQGRTLHVATHRAKRRPTSTHSGPHLGYNQARPWPAERQHKTTQNNTRQHKTTKDNLSHHCQQQPRLYKSGVEAPRGTQKRQPTKEGNNVDP